MINKINISAISEDDDLASDGPKSPICTGIAEKQHYCIWYSTIEDFKSMRHKVDGTIYNKLTMYYVNCTTFY